MGSTKDHTITFQVSHAESKMEFANNSLNSPKTGKLFWGVNLLENLSSLMYSLFLTTPRFCNTWVSNVNISMKIPIIQHSWSWVPIATVLMWDKVVYNEREKRGQKARYTVYLS